jgi:predicted nucleic acid-binding protein
VIGDTDFFIDLMRRRSLHHPAAVEKVRALEARGIRIAMTAVTRFELSAGVEGSTAPERERRKVLRTVESYPTFPLDGPSADRAGRIHGSLQSRGVRIPADDAMIAGIAIENRESVLTRDTIHFRRVEGLVVEPY